MRSLVRDRLPYFTEDEQMKLAGAYNILALNYYTSRFSKHMDVEPMTIEVALDRMTAKG
jgi:beta-glucosidase